MTNDPFLVSSDIRADIQTTHMRRRSALALRNAAGDAPEVTLDRLVNERVAILDDGRRVNLRFVERAAPGLRPSRGEVRRVSELLRGLPARLVLMRGVGTGMQADIAYRLRRSDIPGSFGDPQRQTLAAIAETWLTLGILLAGFGLVTVGGERGDGEATSGHLFLLNGAQTDARDAGIGIHALRKTTVPADLRGVFVRPPVRTPAELEPGRIPALTL